jgi:metal-responsive CopG/Arc/MetJ family transcriptional regulator
VSDHKIQTFNVPLDKQPMYAEFEAYCKRTLKSKSRVVLALIELFIKEQKAKGANNEHN